MSDVTSAPNPDSAGPAPDPVQPDPEGAARAALARLDGLESDIAAVEQAIESMERIAVESGGRGGEASAASLRSVVSVERFGD